MEDSVQNYNEIPEYLYSKDFETVSFGTFLKHPHLPLPKDESWHRFETFLKDKMHITALAYSDQIHKNAVLFLDDIPKLPFQGFDAIITNRKKIALLSFHADCQVVFFYDPINEVIAIAHAGFRGQILSIYTSVIEGMKKRYHSSPKNIFAIMSFSLCQRHAEFIHYEKEFPKHLWDYGDDYHHFDLKKMAIDELLQSGIPKENITPCLDCNAENSDFFYSYRKEKTPKRHISYIFLHR